jgi:hypothetical protein
LSECYHERYYPIAIEIDEELCSVSEKSWAAFGRWAYVSLAVALFFSGIACLIGRVEEVKRPAGIVLALLGAWMIIVLYRSSGTRVHQRFVATRRRIR